MSIVKPSNQDIQAMREYHRAIGKACCSIYRTHTNTVRCPAINYRLLLSTKGRDGACHMPNVTMSDWACDFLLCARRVLKGDDLEFFERYLIGEDSKRDISNDGREIKKRKRACWERIGAEIDRRLIIPFRGEDKSYFK